MHRPFLCLLVYIYPCDAVVASILDKVVEEYSSQIRVDMHHDAVVLVGKVEILDLDFHVVIAFFVEPFRKMRHQSLKIRDSIVSCFHVVVAKVFHLVCRAYCVENLLCPEFVHRVSCLLGDDGIEFHFFLLRGKVTRE